MRKAFSTKRSLTACRREREPAMTEESASANGAQVRLRAATQEDDNFLYKVYACTRADEMALVPWDESQKETFLKSNRTRSSFIRTHIRTAQQTHTLARAIGGSTFAQRQELRILYINPAGIPKPRIGTPLIKGCCGKRQADLRSTLLRELQPIH